MHLVEMQVHHVLAEKMHGYGVVGVLQLVQVPPPAVVEALGRAVVLLIVVVHRVLFVPPANIK